MSTNKKIMKVQSKRPKFRHLNKNYGKRYRDLDVTPHFKKAECVKCGKMRLKAELKDKWCNDCLTLQKAKKYVENQIRKFNR